MPQVPTYDGPQVRTQALRPVYQNAPDVSSGTQAIARGLGQVAEVADSLAQRQMRQQVETESNKLDTEITAGWLEWNTAALRNPAYRGEGVAQYEADAAKWWDDAKQKYTSAASPMVREQLGLSLGRKRTQAVGSVAGYATQERERFADDQAEAAAQKTIEFGIDTGDTAGAAARVRQIAAEKGARKGWSTEMVMAEQQKYLGNLHLSHITRLAENNPVKAREYYEANKGEIPGTAQPRVEQVLKAEADNQFAAQFAAGVAAKPLAEQLSDAAKIDNPERREKALTQIRNNHALVKAAQAEREQVVKDQAWQLVGQGKKVPEALLAQMDGRGRVELQDYLKTRAKQASEGTQVKTDWATYIDAREKLAAGEKVNLVALTTKIAPAQMEQLLDIQTKAKNPSKAPEVASSEQQLGAFTTSLDLKGENLGKFKAAAYDMFNEHLKRTGKEPTFEERDKIMRDLNREIVTKPGRWWDTTDLAYKAEPETRRRALAAPAAPAAPLRVKTVEEARALKPGTVFIDPQGVERIR
jgi:hypothetical protein